MCVREGEREREKGKKRREENKGIGERTSDRKRDRE